MRDPVTQVTFRCEAREVTIRYLGASRWSLSGSVAEHGNVAGAIRAALGLAGEIPFDTKVIELFAPSIHGTLKNNTFPTDLWIGDLDGDGYSAGIAERGLDAAIVACLVKLRLVPPQPPVVPAVRLDHGFSRAALERAPDPLVWARELERVLSDRLIAAWRAESEVGAIVEQLNVLGHKLFHDGDEDNRATWTYDYVSPPRGPRLVIQFAYPAYEAPTVEISLRPTVA